MATNSSIKALLINEIDRANEVTAKNDTNIHNAIGSLIDGYGTESNNSGCKLLNSIILDQNASAVTIDITEDMKSKYDAFIFDFNINFSESDWLYFGSSNNPNQFYFYKSESIEYPSDAISFGIIISKNLKNKNNISVVSYGIVTKGNGYFSRDTWDSLSGVTFKTYQQNITMLAGSKVSMRGVKIYVD